MASKILEYYATLLAQRGSQHTMLVAHFGLGLSTSNVSPCSCIGRGGTTCWQPCLVFFDYRFLRRTLHLKRSCPRRVCIIHCPLVLSMALTDATFQDLFIVMSQLLLDIFNARIVFFFLS